MFSRLFELFNNVECIAFGSDFLNRIGTVCIKIDAIILVLMLVVGICACFFDETKLGRAIKYHWKHWERRKMFVRNVKAICRGASRDIYRKVVSK